MKNPQKIYVIGSGAVAMHCAELLLARERKCVFLDSASRLSPFMHRRLSALQIPVHNVSKNNICYYLGTNTPALVLSVANMLIFPPEILTRPNLKIFNYHNSLLPAHRGVNAEAWTIYNGDKTTGVTWHKVDQGIDTGDILAQVEFSVPPHITAGELLKLQACKAIRLLEENMDSLLSGQISLKKQSLSSSNQFHKLSERPNKGILSPDWSAERIWNFLRAFDYGAVQNLGRPKIKIGDEYFSWRNYEKMSEWYKVDEYFPKSYRIGNFILHDLFSFP